jgi:hypothetical protein
MSVANAVASNVPRQSSSMPYRFAFHFSDCLLLSWFFPVIHSCHIYASCGLIQ